MCRAKTPSRIPTRLFYTPPSVASAAADSDEQLEEFRQLAKAQQDQLREVVEQQATEVGRLTEELTASAAQLQQLEQRVKHATATEAALRDARKLLTDSQEKLHKLQRAAAVHQFEKGTVELEQFRLAVRKTCAGRAQEELEVTIATQQRMMAQLQVDLNNANAGREQLREELAAETAQANAKSQEYTDLFSRWRKAEGRIKEAEAQVEQLRRENRALREQQQRRKSRAEDIENEPPRRAGAVAVGSSSSSSSGKDEYASASGRQDMMQHHRSERDEEAEDEAEEADIRNRMRQAPAPLSEMRSAAASVAAQQSSGLNPFSRKFKAALDRPPSRAATDSASSAAVLQPRPLVRLAADSGDNGSSSVRTGYDLMGGITTAHASMPTFAASAGALQRAASAADRLDAASRGAVAPSAASTADGSRKRKQPEEGGSAGGAAASSKGSTKARKTTSGRQMPLVSAFQTARAQQQAQEAEWRALSGGGGGSGSGDADADGDAFGDAGGDDTVFVLDSD